MSARLLVIEDNPADIYLLEEALREHNVDAEVRRFGDGEEALRALSDDPDYLPDLVLLDLNLPKSDGQQILAELRALSRLEKVPIAVLSSSQSPLDREIAARVGATTFLRKAPTLDEFLDLGRSIRDLLEGASRT